MAKVGILSMQRIINYGSFLQAYGLKSILEEMGHEVQFVDYRVGTPLIEENNSKRTGLRRKIYKALEVLEYNAPLRQKIQFIKYKKEFAKKYHTVLGLSKEENYTPELDVLVIGSDEVFNCIQGNTNVGYSLELFGKNNKAGKVITYAASFGNTTLDKLKKYGKADEIGDLLKKIYAVSVRDENSAFVVKNLTGKQVRCYLDPVLAYDYMNKCDRIPNLNIEEKYMVLYAYSGRISDDEAEAIKKYAQQKKLKIYAIGGVQKCADRFIDCSPFEVLTYFKNAEEVITDTFHGSIFSIITHRPFVTLVRKSVGNAYGNEEKLTDLLKRLELTERIAFGIDEALSKQNKLIDYKKVDSIIDAERMRTRKFLLEQVK